MRTHSVRSMVLATVLVGGGLLGGSSVSGAATCTAELAVGADLGQALATAATNPVSGLLGPSGDPQGRVYLGPHVYTFPPTQMVSNVRIEVAPGATIRPRPGSDGPGPGDWGLFTFGTPTAAVRNVSLVNGDGCGGPGTPTAANKPSGTGFRGNRAFPDGMANEAVPAPGWSTDGLWVMDIDPGFNQVDVQITALMFRWAIDVQVRRIFTIQNATRLPDPQVGPVDGVTSRTTAMMFDPFEGPPATANRRITVDRSYNILAPSGQGNTQIRGCVDCAFTNMYGHGGVALRVETDGIANSCPGGNPDITVNRLSATRIEGSKGRSAVLLSAHCQHNGVVTVTGATGRGEYQAVGVGAGEGGSFATGSIVFDVTACGGSTAQEPHPQENSYVLVDSDSAVAFAPGVDVAGGGTYAWPNPPLPGLPNGQLPQTGDYQRVVLSPTDC